MNTANRTLKKMTKYWTNVTLEKTLEGGSIYETPGSFPSPHVSSVQYVFIWGKIPLYIKSYFKQL